MTVHAFIDGDWILYAAGFAGQKTFYVQPGATGQEEFATLTDLRSNPEFDEELPVYSRIVLDPPEHFYHSAKKMIESQLQKISEKFNVETVTYDVIIDGDGNFRNRIATMRPYKGNRAPDSKPKMYNEIRQYLLDAWDADVVYDQETDDEMTIRQTAATQRGITGVIVGVDKDYLQCPGWVLNPSKGFKRIGKTEGRWRLYVQCLTGDTADNIPGCYKVGPAAAKKLISPKMTERAMWEATVAAYRNSIDKYPSAYPEGMTAEEAATENMLLVYLRREYEETWTPPKAD
ncbi:MAG: hypothetical protein ACYTBJ_23885 [Planctomycetota bacterium]